MTFLGHSLPVTSRHYVWGDVILDVSAASLASPSKVIKTFLSHILLNDNPNTEPHKRAVSMRSCPNVTKVTLMHAVMKKWRLYLHMSSAAVPLPQISASNPGSSSSTGLIRARDMTRDMLFLLPLLPDDRSTSAFCSASNAEGLQTVAIATCALPPSHSGSKQQKGHFSSVLWCCVPLSSLSQAEA